MSAENSSGSDQGDKFYTAEELYTIFPQFFKKEDMELFEYLKRGPEIPDDLLPDDPVPYNPVLVCSWVDAELETAGGHGLPPETTLEQKKTAIGASLVANGAKRVGTSGTAFCFQTSDDLYTTRRNMLNPGAPNHVAWAFNISAIIAANIGGNIVATNPRVNSVIIASIADITTLRQNVTYVVIMNYRFFEI